MKQSGMALLEALVAAGLLALGLLGAGRLTLRALDAALQTRQHEQAQALAREALDCAVAQATPCPAAASVSRDGVTYTVQLQQRAIAPFLAEVSVQVEWRTSAGAQNLNWQTRRSELPGWVGVSSP